MRIISLFLLLSLFAFTSCKDKKSTAESDRTSPEETIVPFEVVNYRKTPCFGVCPTFEMIVMSDGMARYEGQRNVEMEGVWTGAWTNEQIELVRKTAERIGFFQMEDEYNNKLVTDLPATYTTVYSGKKTKTVMNRYKGPEELQELYMVLDDLIKRVEWKKLENN
ncbi:MAG: hypothetical protein HKN32_05465 [Flavobacteriales bacterium]|nr:hypothetical protein [Flavobacteriales bacterium]